MASILFSFLGMWPLPLNLLWRLLLLHTGSSVAACCMVRFFALLWLLFLHLRSLLLRQCLFFTAAIIIVRDGTATVALGCARVLLVLCCVLADAAAGTIGDISNLLLLHILLLLHFLFTVRNDPVLALCLHSLLLFLLLLLLLLLSLALLFLCLRLDLLYQCLCCCRSRFCLHRLCGGICGRCCCCGRRPLRAYTAALKLFAHLGWPGLMEQTRNRHLLEVHQHASSGLLWSGKDCRWTI
mmetsp:Transcript_15361/g.35051  ORF Transcript_15361/g.35051 Transcript_15361/m.35051 type:complete len:240 (-) Transcript_15361:2062-2781(-)